MSGTSGRYTRERLDQALADVCAQAGLDPDGATLIKFTVNAVYQLRQPVVVRISGSKAVAHRAPKVVAVATWLAQHDFPAVRLLPGVAQPVQAGDHVATFWEQVPATGPEPTATDLGILLRRLHTLPEEIPLPQWDPLGDVRRRLDDAEGLNSADAAFLRTKAADLAVELHSLRPVLPPGPIHGDAQKGNLIGGPHGAVLADFDSFCTGPREWDLVPVAFGRARFSYPSGRHEALAASYGYDVTTWSGWPTLRAIRELKLITSAVPVLRSRPTMAENFRHRLNTVINEDLTTKWVPYR